MSRSACAPRRRVWYAVLAAIAVTAPLWALDPQKPVAHYSHRVWHTADGLPQDSVRAIAQTKDGYLWLGTQSGLARFDGEHFTIFDRLNSPLKHDHILALYASRDGPLWIGTADAGGLYRWSAQTGFVWVWSGSNVRALFEDRHGDLWFGTQGKGLLRVNSTRMDVFRVAEDLGINDVRSIVQDRSGVLWIGTDGAGLIRYDGKAFVPYGIGGSGLAARIWSLWADSDGSLWVGTKGGGLIRVSGRDVSASRPAKVSQETSSWPCREIATETSGSARTAADSAATMPASSNPTRPRPASAEISFAPSSKTGKETSGWELPGQA